MQARIFQWLRQRKTLFHMAKATQSAYIFFHNHLHGNPNLMRNPIFSRKTRIGEGATIHPTAFIAQRGVKIGNGCTIGPSAVILTKSRLEDDVEIGPGAVIGSQGFVNERRKNRVFPVKHSGGVRVAKGARIGANTCIDCSTFRGRTEIGAGTSVGAMVHIAHDISTGERCRIEDHAMVGGRVTLGDQVVLGRNCSLSHFLVIGDRTVVMDSAVVTKDLPADSVVEGNFAIDSVKFRGFMRAVAAGEWGSE